jgi:hypothetical protein
MIFQIREDYFLIEIKEKDYKLCPTQKQRYHEMEDVPSDYEEYHSESTRETAERKKKQGS